MEIGYKIFNGDSIDIKFKKTASSKGTTYKWMATELAGIPHEPNSLDFRYYAAHILIYIKGYTVNGTRIKVLSSVDDLHSWYYNLVENVNKTDNSELKQFVDSLVKDCNSDIEKVKRVYYWVQDNIRYIAVEEGLGGFIPRDAYKVFLNRYGDCKDMSSIITKMLEMAGVQSYLTWIGTRDIPYSYYDVCTPSVDNHMLASFKANGKFYFLDATGGYLPLGLPSSFIQGKEALINLGEKNYKITAVDEIAAEKNMFVDTINIELNEDKITGNGVAYYSGYNDVFVNKLLQEKTIKEQTDILNKYYTKGNNKYYINNLSVENLGNRDKDAIVHYNFEIEDYAKKIGDKIFINMNLDKNFQYNKIREDRKLDISQDYKNITEYYITFKVPEGYEIEYLPVNSSYSNLLFGYTIGYSVHDNSITLNHTIKINHLLLKKDMFDKWNEMISKLQSAYSEVVLLKKSEK